jgi:hypothetical protein
MELFSDLRVLKSVSAESVAICTADLEHLQSSRMFPPGPSRIWIPVVPARPLEAFRTGECSAFDAAAARDLVRFLDKGGFFSITPERTYDLCRVQQAAARN